MGSPRVAFVAPLLAGCSLIYNPSNLPDPRAIDAAVVDANPCALVIDDVAPKTIDEGQGAGGSAPAVLVLHGNNIVNANLKVELKAKAATTVHLSPVTDAVASADHTYAAFTVTAAVDDQLGAVGVPLDIVVTQDAPADGGCMSSATATLSGKLSLQGLPELTGKTSINASALEGKYSKVDLATVSFTGSQPAVVHAVSSIDITAAHADASMTAAGPGGNTGTTGMGACPTAGGGGDIGKDANLSTVIANGGGGGGGGGSTAGMAGATGSNGRGGTGGAAGVKNGSDLMHVLDGNAACAGGGGGLGGTLVLTNPGGAGGGGGGTLVLYAGGDITVPSITAIGGQGVMPAAGGGGGGGGAGGNVLVRSDGGTLTVSGAIDVHGGAGGDPGGGAGAPGRVRWDAPVGSAPSGTSHRGPSFAPLATRILTTASFSLMVKGTSGDGFTSRVLDAGGQSRDLGHASFNNSLAVVAPTLQPGFNRVCVTLDGGAQEHPEADTCIDVAFLP
jgi:hypothetical protein